MANDSMVSHQTVVSGLLMELMLERHCGVVHIVWASYAIKDRWPVADEADLKNMLPTKGAHVVGFTSLSFFAQGQ